MTLRLSPSEAADRIEGLLVVGHGTRDLQGREEFLETVRLVQQQAPELAVEPGFLELCAPGIREAIDCLQRRGARRIVAVPLMLFAAGHVKSDIPAAVAAAAAHHPGLQITMAAHLGCRPRLVELSRQRFLESIAGARADDHPTPAAPIDRLLLLVGRGSYDPAATSEMHEFAELRRRGAGGMDVQAAFLAMARPSLDEVLPLLEAAKYEQIVVQPHLLFQGDLLARLGRQVAEIRSRARRQTWIVAPHLGPHPLLAEAILEISGLAGQENPANIEATIVRNK